MSDYELQLKIKNAPMLNAMRECGMKTAADLARAAGLSQTTVGKMLNLSLTCCNKLGEVRSNVQAVADVLGEPPDMLFPAGHIIEPLEENTFTAQVTVDEMARLTNNSGAVDPMLLLEREERDSVDLCADILKKSSLNKREVAVMTARYAKGLTYREAGKPLGLTPERVRQIVGGALRKLRHNDDNFALLKNLNRDYGVLES